MATSLGDCFKMETAIKNAGTIFGMGHGLFISLYPGIASTYTGYLVLRYSPYGKEITKIVRSGILGELINAVQIEPVGYYHFSHSFVRGNWSSENASSFSLMTKSCQ